MHTVTFSHRFLLFGSKLEFPWDCGTIQSHAKTLPCARSLSKYAGVEPLKTKTGESLVEAFSRIIKKGRTPGMFHTDKGTEFTNKKFQKLLKEHNIRFFTTHNETKASIVEFKDLIGPSKEKCGRIYCE